MLEDTVRHAKAAHVGILCRRDIKQPVVFPAEGVGGLRELVLVRLLLEARIGVKRVLLALDLFLLVELAAGGDRTVLREQMLSIGAGWNRRRGLAAEPAPGTRDLKARGEAFEI